MGYPPVDSFRTVRDPILSHAVLRSEAISVSESRHPPSCPPVRRTVKPQRDRDALTVTILDRATAALARDGREAFVAEADPLPYTDWGVGGRPVRRECAVTPPPALRRLDGSKAGRDRYSGTAGGDRSRVGRGKTGAGEQPTVELTIRWSPRVRLKEPLAAVALAGQRTASIASNKVRC